MNILNKLIEYGSVKNVGEQYLLSEEMYAKVVAKIKNANCISNYALDIPVIGKTCNIPVADISALGIIADGGIPVDISTLSSISNTTCTLKEILAFIPINNTTLKFNKVALEDYISDVIAKIYTNNLNKLAYESLLAKKPTTTPVTMAVVIDSIVRNCLKNKEKSAILVDEGSVFKLIDLLKLDINKEINILGVPVVVCDGFTGVIVGDFSSACAYVHSDNLGISYNSSTMFTSNITLACASLNANISALDLDSYDIFTI